jgi:predicted DNA-binding WGR domain protein
MIYLQSIDPTANRRRWYSLQLQPCLFGGVDLIHRRGRLGQSGGAARVSYLADEGTAAATIARTVRRRERHDYRPTRSSARIGP